MSDFVFIVGSPRSGTTLVGRILSAHKDIQTWFVPYFIWEKRFVDRPDDVILPDEASTETVRFIRREFGIFKRKSGTRLIVDQSPRNSMRVRFIRTVFPEARFIHVIRDGRDAVLSINKEWQRRQASYIPGMPQAGGSMAKSRAALRELLAEQPYWRNKIQALLFEFGGFPPLPGRLQSRRRWRGHVGWGPRFPGWAEKIKEVSLLEFNAMQWREAVRSVEDGLADLEPEAVFRLRYEELLGQPEKTVTGALEFLGCQVDEAYLERIPKIKQGNFNKWRNEFEAEQVKVIQDIMGDQLKQLGYL